jgi:hypothetical protein
VEDGIRGDADVGVAVVRRHSVAAVGIAHSAREIAAGHIDLDAVAGADGVVEIAESGISPCLI